MPPICDLKDVRPYLDAVANRHPILSLPRDEALAHVLRAVQSRDIAGLVFNTVTRSYHGFYEPLRMFQDALKYLVFKIVTRCPPGGDSHSRSRTEHLELASDAINCFRDFSAIHDGVLSTEAGFTNLEVDGRKRSVRFSYPGSGVEQRVRCDLAQQHELAATKQRDADQHSPSVSELASFRDLLRTVSVEPDWQSFKYAGAVPDAALKEGIERAAKATKSASDLPEEWMIGPYTVGDHRRVWWLLYALSAMHTQVLAKLTFDYRRPPPPCGAELRLAPARLFAACERLLGVSPDATRGILADLTYDPSVRWTDVTYQPLFSTRGGEYLSCRVLIEGSSFERNLLALLPRLQARRAGKENLDREREQVMIDELSEVALPLGLGTRPRVPLRAERRMLTDVDLLIWGQASRNAIAVSLKWYFGPDSMQEVINHDGWFREAIPIAAAAAKFVQDNSTELSQRFSLSPALAPGTRVQPLIVSRAALPSGLVDTSTCPVVTQAYFSRLLREAGGDLEQVMQRLPEPLPVIPANYQTECCHQEIRFGAEHFFLPALEVSGEE